MEEQKTKRTLVTKLKSFITQSRRVFRVTKKPGKEEFRTIVKVTAIGIAVIGAIGFIIHVVWKVLS
jgi:protein transport protein SEC61 subunit gamma and related proteins